MSRIFLSFAFIWIFILADAQEEVIYQIRQTGFYQDSILSSLDAAKQETGENMPAYYLTLDFSGLDFPDKPDDYDSHWHNAPLSQGATGTCWCFATLSFLESEIYRKSGKTVKLSEMYIVYWEYVARAKYFVRNRGDMYLGEGSESNAVTRIMKDHGLVPAGQYSGLHKGQRFHDHRAIVKEIRTYFNFIEENNIWDEAAVVANVKSILDHHFGMPPQTVSVDGKEISPIDYMKDVAGLDPDDYFCFMSTKAIAYNQKGELKEPDNWWHSDDYYNVSLDEFSALFTDALDQGYTLSICGDVSEPGYDRYSEVGIIPTFDIPAGHIDENARELRLYNGSTTDDHCIHVVGYTRYNGALWYLIKDSSSSGFDGPNKGYRFMREDYIKLKIIAVMTHKYAARKILDKIIK
jgi:bleomycin hydrolase